MPRLPGAARTGRCPYGSADVSGPEMFAQNTIPNPMDVDLVLFCKCVIIKMAHLGALSVHVIELLKFFVGDPAFKGHEGNAGILIRFGPLLCSPQSSKAESR